jgi:hypothetical protein
MEWTASSTQRPKSDSGGFGKGIQILSAAASNHVLGCLVSSPPPLLLAPLLPAPPDLLAAAPFFLLPDLAPVALTLPTHLLLPCHATPAFAAKVTNSNATHTMHSLKVPVSQSSSNAVTNHHICCCLCIAGQTLVTVQHSTLKMWWSSGRGSQQRRAART